MSNFVRTRSWCNPLWPVMEFPLRAMSGAMRPMAHSGICVRNAVVRVPRKNCGTVPRIFRAPRKYRQELWCSTALFCVLRASTVVQYPAARAQYLGTVPWYSTRVPGHSTPVQYLCTVPWPPDTWVQYLGTVPWSWVQLAGTVPWYSTRKHIVRWTGGSTYHGWSVCAQQPLVDPGL
jgi:hypothetical protein